MSNEQLIREFIGDTAFDELTEDEQQQLCAGDSAWITGLVQARQQLPLPPVPPLLSQNLRDLFDTHRLVQRHVATLVSDSRHDRRLVGVRGADTAAGWSFTYSCEAADIVLDIWPRRDNVDVEVQIMTQASDAIAYGATAQPVTNDSGVTIRGETNDIGQIRLAGLEPVAYELTLSNLRSELLLQVDLGDQTP